MPLSFKEEVALALLRNMEWMVKFDGVEAAAGYAGLNVPEKENDAIALQQKIIAIQVAETAKAIVSAVEAI